ncbi:cytochrome c oxidase subunit 7A, mitochondrial [Panulirus ornatus]|uniref:cytochrome c oxidase subunit 7A, mitochondrial n=1 Tax=Panulirus ornatus TaxID=150431 RepID=UPI003A87238B
MINSAARALVRTFATTSARTAIKNERHLGYQKIRDKMFAFQIDNGAPIHLKGGMTDNMLFISTLILNGVGLFMCFEFFYSKAFPKRIA